MDNRSVIIVLVPVLLLLPLGTAIFFLSSESNSDSPISNNESGTVYWKTSTPEEQGMSSEKLGEVRNYIENWDLDFHSVLVVCNGYIVLEEYFDYYRQDTLREIYSCTKSVTSALVGIAIHEGYISSVDERVLDYFPEKNFTNLDARKQNMTLEHLLTMTTGLDWPEWSVPYGPGNIFAEWVNSPDWVQFVLDRPMVLAPGTQFNYNSGASHILSAILQNATGETTFSYANRHLFAPLGISPVIWRADPQGINAGGMYLQMRPRDMAKIGYLYLNNGSWEGKQIIPADWVEISTRKHYDMGNSAVIDYGYQWWIYYYPDLNDSSKHPPIDAYAAVGYSGQRIFVIPDQRMVVVFTADIVSTPLKLGINTSIYVYLITAFIIEAVESSSQLNLWSGNVAYVLKDEFFSISQA
ncbi:MAG: serine hydrolase domain-containing protein [Candidatus Heimdallarchaeota archaeon]